MCVQFFRGTRKRCRLYYLGRAPDTVQMADAPLLAIASGQLDRSAMIYELMRLYALRLR